MDPQDPDTYLAAVHSARPAPTLDETGLALDVDGLTVRARLVLPDGPSRAAVLLVHGWTSSSDLHDLDVARDLARSGLTALAVDLPGHGRSDGVRDEITLATFVAAVLAAHDALRDAAGEVPVLAVGSSFGGYLCARLARERALHAVALRVPANYPDERDGDTLGGLVGEDAIAWRARPLPSRATAAMRGLADFGGDVLVLQAEHDDLIPAQSIANLNRDVPADRLTHVVLAGAPHVIYTVPAVRAAADDLVATWVREHTGVLALMG
jgi:hypothetical protein